MQHAHVFWNDGENRNLQVALYIFEAFHRRIQILQEKGDPDTEDQSHHRTKNKVQGNVRTHRTFGNLWLLVNLDALLGHSSGDRLADQFQLHRLEQLLVGLKLALGIYIVLRVKSPFNCFLPCFVLHDFHVLQTIFRHSQLHLQSRPKVNHTFIKLKFHTLNLLCSGQHRRVPLSKAACFNRSKLTDTIKILWIKILDDIVGQIESRRIDHQLITVIFQKTVDLAAQLHLFLLQLVVCFHRGASLLILIDT